jgi:hypothetical protein
MQLKLVVAMFFLALRGVIGGAVLSTQAYPGGIVLTFSNVLQVLEVADSTDPFHRTLNACALINLRKSSARTLLSQLSGDRSTSLEVYLNNPIFGEHSC